MAEMLQALDSGPQALPLGSTATLVNQHPECEADLGEAACTPAHARSQHWCRCPPAVRHRGRPCCRRAAAHAWLLQGRLTIPLLLPAAAPAGTFVHGGRISSLQLCHAYADPRSRAALADGVEMARQTAALVVWDTLWRSGSAAGVPTVAGQLSSAVPSSSAPELAAPVGPDATSLPDVLRMDAAVLTVQLNVVNIRMRERRCCCGCRQGWCMLRACNQSCEAICWRRLPPCATPLLQATGRPDINIVCEKQSHQGLTRYEDTDRLPLGIAIVLMHQHCKFLGPPAGPGTTPFVPA